MTIKRFTLLTLIGAAAMAASCNVEPNLDDSTIVSSAEREAVIKFIDSI